jgi:hypothetical protein
MCPPLSSPSRTATITPTDPHSLGRILPGKRALRIHHHVFYVFSPRPPFELLGLGRPFMFPSELGMIQTASGMLLHQDGSLVVSFGEQDCESRRAAVPLDAVLSQLRLTPSAR